MEIIFKRRSIRRYKDDPVKDEEIVEIIKAGMAAPSANNEKPWYFIIIKKKTLFDSIQKIHPHSRALSHAQTAILVCGDLSLDLSEGFWVQDCAACTQNILLAAS